MTYYRVKKQYDNIMRKRWTGKRFVFDGYYIQNELYTPSEMKKLKLANPESIFDKVEIKKTKTYWFFGARFGFDKTYND